MATTFFEVKTYTVALWAKGRTPWSFIKCFGENGQHTLWLTFVDDIATAPGNTATIETNAATGQIYAPAGQYVWYLDLLRNEGPVYAFLNDAEPSANHLRTSAEPVGDGER